MKIFTLSKLTCASLLIACASGTASAQEASLTDVTPAPGSSFGPNDTSGVTVFFEPEEVSISGASVIYTPVGSTSTSTKELSCSQDAYRPGHPWEIGLMDNLLWFIATQEAEMGTTVSVILENVNYQGNPVMSTSINSSDIIFEDGNIILNYKVPDVIFSLTNQVWPSVYYADWSKTDELPTATLTFNEDVAYVGYVSYRTDNSEFGAEGGSEDVEFGEFPENICTIAGNIVTLDFSKYTPNFVLTPKVLSVYVVGVTSVSGQELKSVPTGHMTYDDNSLSTGIDEINLSQNEKMFYNLQGQQITNPQKGQLLIKVENGIASKTIIR